MGVASALAFGALAGTLVVRTILLVPKVPAASEGVPPPFPKEEEGPAIERFARLVRIPTISEASVRTDAPFAAMRAALAEMPAATWLTRRDDPHALVWTWPGKDPSAKAIVVLAHHDVVPIEPGTEAKWSHPPFGGDVEGGFVWGRGALDDKASLGAMLEAVAWLHAEGFVPDRTIHLVSSDDEELGGTGALGVAKRFADEKVAIGLVLDEGLSITKRIVPGVTSPVALLGIAEKGYATLAFDVTEGGGHSSMPPRSSAIGKLSAAITKLQASPFPVTATNVRSAFQDALAPHLPFGQRLVMGNRWLFGSLVDGELAKSPASDALLRTTMAPTIVRAGTAENVLATSAHALVNFRIIPGETVASVLARVKDVIADPSITVTVLGNARDPSTTTRLESKGYMLVEATVRASFPGTVVMPGLVLGGTDSHVFGDLADAVVRFAPVPFEADDLGRVHGTDERISVGAYIDHIRFDAALLRRAAATGAL
ncbi:MAG: M20/M25/M40 family metallo-hydrolase [Polyangiaceae bacterium]